MAVHPSELGHAPRAREVQPPIATPEIRDNVGPPIGLSPEEPLSSGMLKLAEIVGPVRWNALVLQARSDMTHEEIAAFVRTLRATPVLDERPAKWSKDDWRVSRHDTDAAFTLVETGRLNGGLREAQAGFTHHLDRFIRGFPEGEGDMRELFQAMFELGTSGDWQKKPILARELANAYWDVGERVLESWTAQPVRRN